MCGDKPDVRKGAEAGRAAFQHNHTEGELNFPRMARLKELQSRLLPVNKLAGLMQQ